MLKNFIKKKLKIYPFYNHNPYITYLYSHPSYSFFLHILKMITAHVLSLNLKIKKNRITNFFHKNGFYKRILKNNEFPHELFSIIDNEVKNPPKNSEIIFCHLSNYTHQKIDIKLIDSQYHVKKLEKNLLIKTDKFLRDCPEFDNTIKYYFKTDYRITNIRLWRYFSNKNQNLKTEVKSHFDKFPHKTLKIMIYKGFFDKKVGALEIVKDDTSETLIYSVKGLNPIVLIDTNHLYHRAKFPKQDRDTIEITVNPALIDRKPLYGGFSAGHPINPFRKNSYKEII